MQNFKKAIMFISLASLPLLGGSLLTGCAVKQQDESVGQYVDGSVMTTTVKSRILADKSLQNTTISVKTFQDTVQLSGFVNTNAQRLHAAKVAMSVDGVRKVDNALIIKRMVKH